MPQKFFGSLDINQKVKAALQAMHLSGLTPVQEQTIPEFLVRDVIVQSQTGSGKTLAYLIPVINTIENLTSQRQEAMVAADKEALPVNGNTPAQCVTALVIVPTRELCSQVAGTAASLGTTSTVFIGGTPIEDDLKKPDSPLVIGTPGRLLEIISRNSKRFSKIKYLVLDESDKLLSLGFEEKLLKILEFLPRGRRTGLFSATVSEMVAKFSLNSLRNPLSIKITESLPENLRLEYLVVEPSRKLCVLQELIRGRKAIVFFSTCMCVNFYYELMKSTGRFAATDGAPDNSLAVSDTAPDHSLTVNNAAPEHRLDLPDPSYSLNAHGIYRIHGKMPQSERNEVYSGFEADGRVLFCTDVAARGIDFKDIEIVVHFDIPKDYTNIVHRSGRTARMGSVGEAVLFLMPNEKTFVNFLKLKGIAAIERQQPSTPQSHGHEEPRVPEELLRLAVQAFVSYIRGYKEHVLNYILNYKELDFDGLAELFRLERIPSMEELRNVKFKKFERGEQRVKRKKRS